MKKTYREENGKLIKGVSLPVFIHNVNYHLTDIHIYEDGLIDCWELVDLDGFKERIRTGWIKTRLPDGKDISVMPMGHIEIKKFWPGRTEDELIKEVIDILKWLNGEETSEDVCRKKFEEYLKDPADHKKEELGIAYSNVSAHNRKFLLGDMDVDDFPIQAVIYGDIVFKKYTKAGLNEDYIRNVFLKGLEIEKSH